MDPVTIGLIITAIAGAGSAYQQKQSADYQEDVAKYDAEQVTVEARERELVRKEKINKVLAAQIAGLGASGITSEGSPQVLAVNNIRQESLDGLASDATRAGQQNSLLSQGSAARELGNLQAATTLIGTGSSMYSSYNNL